MTDFDPVARLSGGGGNNLAANAALAAEAHGLRMALSALVKMLGGCVAVPYDAFMKAPTLVRFERFERNEVVFQTERLDPIPARYDDLWRRLTITQDGMAKGVRVVAGDGDIQTYRLEGDVELQNVTPVKTVFEVPLPPEEARGWQRQVESLRLQLSKIAATAEETRKALKELQKKHEELLAKARAWKAEAERALALADGRALRKDNAGERFGGLELE